MKKIFLLIILSVVGANASAFTTWNLQGISYSVDTLSHVVIGPGTTQTTLALSGAVNLRVFYTTTDLTNPNVDLKIVMGKDNLTSTVTVPNMPAYHADKANLYFAGVNADFFSTGPIGTTISDGVLYKSYKGTGWYAFGMDKDKKLYIGAPYSTFKMVSPNAGQASIKAVNVARSTNEMILYTSVKGSATGTGSTGTELAATAVDGGLKGSGITKMRVSTAAVTGVGNMAIPAGGFVLSANGFNATTLSNMKLGEEFEVTPTIFFDNVEVPDMREMAGGCPVLLKAGVIQDTQGLLDHLSTRQPRTAVGYDAAGTQLVMLVVDGRLPGVSVGVTSKDLAAIMRNVGCTESLNFDGGGSSTMWIKDFGVLNTPSDGSVRAVKNGLFLTTPISADNAIAKIRFVDFAPKVEKGAYYQPVFYGYNAQGILVDTNVGGVTLSCDASLGTVDDLGSKVLCNGDLGLHPLTATLGALTAQVAVNTVSHLSVRENLAAQVRIYPNPVMRGENAIIESVGGVVKIFSASGQLLRHFSAGEQRGKVELPVNDLPQGLYIVTCGGVDKSIRTKLIIR